MTEVVKPRLLVLTSTFPRWLNDCEPPFVYELSRRLTDRFDITVLAPRAPGSVPRESMSALRVERFAYFVRRWENLATHGGGILNRLRANPWYYLLIPPFLLGECWAVTRLLRRQRFDVIHAHWLLPQGLVAIIARRLARRPVPIVTTSHGGDLYALKGAVPRWLKQVVMKASASVTVVSAAMRAECRALGIPAEKVAVISMGVDMQRQFTRDPGIARSEHELLFVGRLVEKKGLPLLLQALPLVLMKEPRVRLIIAGGGPQEAELRQLVATLGLREQVRFLGMVGQSQLPDLYRRAAVLVAPFVVTDSGDQEGLGLVLVEAAGCGCPVICGEVAAVRDVIQDGHSGRLVDPRNTARLAETILELLRDPGRRERLAANALAHCLQVFDWDCVSRRYASLLLGVAADQSVHADA